jgi:TPR repeat protein
MAALRHRAERGEAFAQNELGNKFDGFGRPEEAFMWYSMAASQGFAPAQNNVGTCYERGFGVKADLAKAAQWYEKGAKGGDAFAQRNLAALLMDGNGVPRNLATGLDWLKKAAAQENYMALYDLGVYFEIGVMDNGLATNVVFFPATDAEGVAFEVPVRELVMTETILLQPDERAALECYRRSQRKGYRPAWWKVGVFAETGRFCQPNPEYARYCYQKAGPGIPQAAKALARMDAPAYRPPSLLAPQKVFEELSKRLTGDDLPYEELAPISKADWPKPVKKPQPPEWPELPSAPPEPPSSEPASDNKTKFSTFPPENFKPKKSKGIRTPSMPCDNSV